MTTNASVKQAEHLIGDEALAEEQLLEELENGEIPSHIREARLTELKHQTREYHEMKEKKHGIYTEIIEEKDFLDMTTGEEKCVVHFFHPDFHRCAVMDKHLQIISEKYFECKFAKIKVTTAKFFVEKLKIRVLPAVICFINGQIVDRIIGFEGLTGGDNFKTADLERRLDKHNLIKAKDSDEDDEVVKGSILGKGRIAKGKDSDTDSDNDW